MTSSINKVTLLGNLGRAPELRYTPSGKAVATLSVATSNRRKNNQTGQWEDETQWHRVIATNQLAEYVAEKLGKGRSVLVEGSLRYGSYTNKEGVRIPTVEILAGNVEPFGAAKKEGGAEAKSDDQQGAAAGADGAGDSAPHQQWVDEYDQA